MPLSVLLSAPSTRQGKTVLREEWKPHGAECGTEGPGAITETEGRGWGARRADWVLGVGGERLGKKGLILRVEQTRMSSLRLGAK